MNRRKMMTSAAAVITSVSAIRPENALSESMMPESPKPVPPAAQKIPKRIEQLDRVRVDDYAWMKDDNWQKVLRDPTLIKAEVKDHLTAENAYVKAMLASTEALQAAMFEEMKGRIKEDDASVPAPDGPWEYYSRFNIGGQHPIFARRPLKKQEGGKTEGEEILLDCDALAKGKAYSQVSAADHSPDHRLFAYAEDAQGSEVHHIYVKDLATGEVLKEPVESSTGDFAWSPDSKWLFWTHRDDNGRSDKIYRRPARGGLKDDVLVYDEPDDGFFVSVGTTSSDAFITISAGDHETSETLLIPAADPTAAPKVVEPRTVGLRYSVEHWDGRFVILTNADEAIDFKLVEAPVATPGRAHWKDFVPHKPGHFITGLAAYKDHLVRVERVNANTRIVITDRASKAEKPIVIDEEAYVLSLEGGYEFDTPVMRYVYQSPTTPRQWFDYDMATGQKTLRKTQEIPSGHDPAQYVTRRLYAKAPDGAEVPITVLMKKGVALDGKAPLLLYGYGSYGIAMEPSFSIRNLSLVDRGWIWATACTRGGSENGGLGGLLGIAPVAKLLGNNAAAALETNSGSKYAGGGTTARSENINMTMPPSSPRCSPTAT